MTDTLEKLVEANTAQITAFAEYIRERDDVVSDLRGEVRDLRTEVGNLKHAVQNVGGQLEQINKRNV